MDLIKIRQSDDWDKVRNKVAIVGSEELSPQQVKYVRHLVHMIIRNEGLFGLVSGGCAGVDSIAEQITDDIYHEPYKIFEPTVRTWGDPGGFKDRNKAVVHEANVVYVIRNRFTKRYGSGWTGDYAEEIGKPVYRYYV